MIKGIIFDVGGVYMQGSIIDFMNKSYKVLGINKVFTTDSLVVFDDDFNRGVISADECFRKVFEVSIDEKQMKQLLGIWTTTWKPEERMINLLNNLQKKYVTAVLSNSDAVNSPLYQKRGWHDPFDYLVLSHEEHINKPDPEIYDITLKRIGLPGSECVFIDDCTENLDVASEKFGMKTILYQNFEQMVRNLKSLGVRMD